MLALQMGDAQLQLRGHPRPVQPHVGAGTPGGASVDFLQVRLDLDRFFIAPYFKCYEKNTKTNFPDLIEVRWNFSKKGRTMQNYKMSLYLGSPASSWQNTPKG